jgi:hypothetical protein
LLASDQIIEKAINPYERLVGAETRRLVVFWRIFNANSDYVVIAQA